VPFRSKDIDMLHAACVKLVALAILAFLGEPVASGPDRPGEWPCYGRDRGGMRHSPLTQIDRTNVARLKPVWTYRTGDLERVQNYSSLKSKIAFEASWQSTACFISARRRHACSRWMR
jgi:hypothetical protein